MVIGPGARLDNYEIIAPLASGGMGEVWLARDLHLDRRVALKILPAHLTKASDRVARFRQEARTASALNHPNVCTIHTLGTADDRLFIAMEFVDGNTLRTRLATDRLSIRQALDIAMQIAAALAAAHAAGVIHRDIKPENIMIRSDGLVKVLDFGLAKLDPTFETGEPARSTRTAILTEGGSIPGTIAYMSPEQARGEPLDARTDVFSLGATLYEMATGQQAFAGHSTAIVYDAILNQMPASPMRLNPDVPPRLEDIIAKALEKDRGLRYQSASELHTDLTRLTRDTNGRDLSAIRRENNRGASGRSRFRIRDAAVAFMVLLTGTLAMVAVRPHWLAFLFPRHQLTPIQLTTNSSEAPVTAAAISPDGKYLAYADLAGVHARLIDSGESHPISAPDIGDVNRVAWFPDSSKLVVSGVDARSAVPSIWSVSLMGGIPRPLRAGGMQASVSPDGSRITFLDRNRGSVWEMGPTGEEPHQLVTSAGRGIFLGPAYWAGGTRLAYARLRLVFDQAGGAKSELTVESRDRNGHITVLFSDLGLRGAVFLPDGRLIYSRIADPARTRAPSLWETRVDLQTGALNGEPRQLGDWPDSDYMLQQFSTTTDAKRIVFLKIRPQQDVYVADLAVNGDPVNPRRLTLDDSNDTPWNWMPDSKAILFTSDRNGAYDIFKQSLDQRTPEAVVSGPDDEMGPVAVSPDGAWFYYYLLPEGWRRLVVSPSPSTLMRIAASGGPPQKVADLGLRVPLCAQLPSTTCVLVERDEQRLTIYTLDPLQGKGSKIASTEIDSSPIFSSALSRDGTRVAILMPAARRIRIMSVDGKEEGNVDIPDRIYQGALFWSADGKRWYLSSPSIGPMGGTDLLDVDLNGQARVVWHQPVPNPQAVPNTIFAIPSPNGRHIAVGLTTTVSNVWMFKDF